MHATRISFVMVSLLVILAAISVPLFAQQSAEADKGNDTPEIRMKKWGLSEDPGDDPDPTKVWIRDGVKYQIHKYDKKWARFDVRPGWVRPHGAVGFEKEVYRQDDQSVWVWTVIMDPTEAEKLVERDTKLSPAAIKELNDLKREFAQLSPADSSRVLKFVESSAGLPTNGSWRNSVDVGDMNNDGFVDIVAPPQRGSLGGIPVIFLGDGKGNWTDWDATDFERSVNYGSVSVGDLNQDGNLDIVCGVHLFGIVAFLGDGKGKFDDASVGLPTKFPTRRARLSDVDRDGDLDIIAINEGPTPTDVSATAQDGVPAQMPGKLRIYLNEKKASSWKLVSFAEPARQLGGDWLTIGNINGDRYPDFVASSVVVSGPDIIWVGQSSARWKEQGRGFLPWQSIYWASTAGNFTSKKREDVILSFGRVWPNHDKKQVPPPDHTQIVGLERVSWKSGKLDRTVIASWPSNRPIWAMASADFDGDANEDIVYWNAGTRNLEFLLGDGKGGFKKASAEGMTVPPNTAYDITVADVNADKRPDIIMAFESQEKGGEKNGSIRVWLNQSQ